MKQARYYRKEASEIACTLCPHHCLIPEGETGRCRVRRNVGGQLIADAWGRVSALHVDPIEKKPLYHFYPGKQILSVGTVGCNLGCRFCQNCQISQSSVDDLPLLSRKTPEEIIEEAMASENNIGIAFTYNEPTVWIEFMLDIARLAKEKGLKTVMVTNGFIDPEPLKEVIEHIDAFNVDLKGFSEDFYRRITFSSLEPVKRTIKNIHQSGKHLELTNLVIPGLNDQEDLFYEMIDWILENAGPETILHISRYFPNHKVNHPPTPLSTLKSFYHHAKEKLHYVYLGNVGYEKEGRDTFCASCKALVVSRNGYQGDADGLDAYGKCKHCGQKVVIR